MMNKILAVFACLFLLTACAEEKVVMVKPEQDTSGKINLDVLSINILDRSSPLVGDTPYLTNNFQPTITNAVRQWATDKLVAVGTTGEAIVVIKDASLKSAAIPHPDSIFTREQASKYTGKVAVELDISGREGHGHVTAEASQFQTLPEDSTAVERQNAYNMLLNNLMRDFSKNFRSSIQDHVGNFVVTVPITQ